MLAIVIAVVGAFLAGFAAHAGGVSSTWSVVIGLACFAVVQLVVSLILRARIKAINAGIQAVVAETQKRIQNRQNQFMRRPGSSPKMMMEILEKEQNQGLTEALAVCSQFKSLYKWNILLKKQVNTMQMAFYYQMHDFAKVDELLPRCLLLDPQSVCMKLARMYKNNDPAIDKFFRKKCSRYKEPDCILPYALYSWILVKQGKTDDAFKVLTEAKKKTDNEVILQNHGHLANNRVKNFSNAGLAESWYALGLENPKMPRVQQNYRYR